MLKRHLKYFWGCNANNGTIVLCRYNVYISTICSLEPETHLTLQARGRVCGMFCGSDSSGAQVKPPAVSRGEAPVTVDHRTLHWTHLVIVQTGDQLTGGWGYLIDQIWGRVAKQQ